MQKAALIFTLALAGCMGVETDCRWDGLTGADCTEGNAGDGVSAAPQAAPEPAARPEPAKPSRSTPEPKASPAARSERPAKPGRAKPDTKPEKPKAEKPEPEKPDYADWSQPGDDAIFEAALAEGYTEADIRAKKDFLALERSKGEAASKAEQSGGYNR